MNKELPTSAFDEEVLEALEKSSNNNLDSAEALYHLAILADHIPLKLPPISHDELQ